LQLDFRLFCSLSWSTFSTLPAFILFYFIFLFWEKNEFWGITQNWVMTPDNKVSSVIKFCHSEVYGGHFSSRKTTAKILQSGFYWPTMFKDSHAFCKTCENCQKLGSISKRHMMPLNPILVIEIFDYWGIDFMGPPFGFLYILVVVDYVSKWIEAISSRNNDHKTMIKFLKENILS
jgi:hypothetical protein